MKGFLLHILLCITLVAFVGCAASYKPIIPRAYAYTSHDEHDGIDFSYKYDVLQDRGNKKYAKKEDKKSVRVVAIKLTNNNEVPITVGRDLAFFSGGKQLYPLDPDETKRLIKQTAPVYLLFLLLTPMNFYTSNGTTENTVPIGLVLGPGIAFGNLALAASANGKLLNELRENDLINKEIGAGQTVYGIISLPETGYDPIVVKLIERK